MSKLFKFFLAAVVFTGVAVSDSTSFAIYVVGDSTVQTYKDNVYPQTGWGQVLGYFFDASRVKVNNYAIGENDSVIVGRIKPRQSSPLAGNHFKNTQKKYKNIVEIMKEGTATEAVERTMIIRSTTVLCL